KTAMDEIEMEFEHQKSEAIPRKPPAPTTGSAKDPAPDPKRDGDSGEKHIAKVAEMGFQIEKPLKFKTLPVDRSTNAQRYLGFLVQAQNGAASATVEVTSYRNGPPANFRLEDYLVGQWTAFVKDHAEGPLSTADLPPPGG